jgi:hypothetical protein
LVIFNKYQLAMFEFIAKEEYTLIERERINSEMNELKILSRDKHKLIELLLQYNREVNNSNQCQIEIDRKLKKYLDIDIKSRLNI